MFVGKNIIKADAADKVRGKALYAADYSMENMLHVVVARSQKAHAKILHIDTSLASQKALVYTAKDFASNVIVDIINDQPVLAEEKTRYWGEPLAIVAASTRAEALEAAKMIQVEYEELPVYTSAADALSEKAISIHPDGNLVSTFEYTKGDPDAAFAQADLVLEHTFHTPYQEHAYMEPDASFSYMENGILVLVTSSQNVFHDQRMAMHALGLTEEQVRVVSATVGGGFGGKDGHMTQLFGALVTQKTGRPAKIVFDRQESIAYTYKRHATDLHVKIGFRKDGTLLAMDADNLLDTGAYIGYGLAVLGLLSEHICGPYAIENFHVRSKLVYTNKTPASAFRGFGAPQAAFATETLINMAAEKLGISPIDIRVKNALQTGDIGALGQVIDKTCGMKDALLMLEKTPLWQEKAQNLDPEIGYGMAAGHLSCGFGKGVPDQAQIALQRAFDGKFDIFVGFTDIGQGSIGSLTAIAADALGVGLDQIRIHMGDTRTTFDCGSTAASRSTFIGGNAILKAVAEYRDREKNGEQNIRVCISVPFPETDAMVNIGTPHAMYTFVAQAIKIHVDKVTGEAKLLDAAVVTEAGKIINPMQFAGQMQGGMAQSMGYALSEECVFTADGHMSNDDFSTYLIPTMMDIPTISVSWVDSYEASGPMGVKGAAESPTVPTAAAVNAAIFDATGIWHDRLPMTPESNLVKGEEA